MRTNFRQGKRLIVEEFSLDEFKEYLMHVVKYSDSLKQLAAIGDAIHGNNSSRFNRDTKEFRLETFDKSDF